HTPARSRARRARSPSRRRLPVAERAQQLVPGAGRDRLLGEPPEQPDRLAHLLQVGPARGARRDVLLEPPPLLERQRPLEVVRHELHELAAREPLRLRRGLPRPIVAVLHPRRLPRRTAPSGVTSRRPARRYTRVTGRRQAGVEG